MLPRSIHRRLRSIVDRLRERTRTFGLLPPVQVQQFDSKTTLFMISKKTWCDIQDMMMCSKHDHSKPRGLERKYAKLLWCYQQWKALNDSNLNISIAAAVLTYIINTGQLLSSFNVPMWNWCKRLCTFVYLEKREWWSMEKVKMRWNGAMLNLQI